jgi:hypothetical protein
MITKSQTKSSIVREYLTRFPSITSNTLAAKLTEEHPLLFLNQELARTNIRYVRGSKGKASKASITNKEKTSYFTEGKTSKGFEPIKGDLNQFEAYQIPLSVGPLNIWGDVHAPYHDHRAIKKAHSLKKGRALLLNGDGADMYLMSRFVHDPRKVSKRTLREDRDMVRELFKQIVGEFDHVYYKKGNHCIRWESYLKIKAPELYDMEEFKFEHIYGLTDLGVHIIQGHQAIQYGDLDIVHGHELAGGFGAGKFVAKALLKKWQQHKKKMEVKILCSHHHFPDEYVLHNDDGSYAYGWVTGCLSDLDAEYNPFNRYEHGFAIASEGPNGVEVENIKFKVR